MKNSPLTQCRKAGCRKFTSHANHYCEAHQALAGQRKKKKNPVSKAVYNSAAWKAIRLEHLSKYPLCMSCGKKGLVTPATLVHHRDENVTNSDEQNLMSLCHDCHEIIHGRKRLKGDRGG